MGHPVYYGTPTGSFSEWERILLPFDHIVNFMLVKNLMSNFIISHGAQHHENGYIELL